MLNKLIVALLVVSCTSCVNLYAGIAQYDVKTFYSQDTKKMECCEVKVTSGKNVGSIVAHIIKDNNNFTVDLNEQTVNSSASISAATAVVSDVSKAVSDTAVTVGKLEGKLP